MKEQTKWANKHSNTADLDVIAKANKIVNDSAYITPKSIENSLYQVLKEIMQSHELAVKLSSPSITYSRQGQTMTILFSNNMVVENNLNKVIKALSSPKWDFRTVRGLAKETALQEHDVIQILNTEKDLIRKSLVPDRAGNALYTLQVRPIKGRERLAEVLSYLNKYF